LYDFHLKALLGGGVSQHPGLIEETRCKVSQFMNGYVQSPLLMNGIDEYIISPSLGNRSGGLGAIAMAMEVEHQT